MWHFWRRDSATETDADARVFDREAQHDLLVRELAVGDGERHAALPRILDGVRQDVHRDLLHAHFVAMKHGRELRIGLEDEREVLVPCADFRHVHEVVEERPEAVLDGYELHLAGLDLREIEDVVDEA